MLRRRLVAPFALVLADARRRTILAAVLFLGLSGLHACHTARRLEDPSHPGRPYTAMQDFRGIAYYPVDALLKGRNPYAPYEDANAFPARTGAPLYLPITFVAHLPFGLLGLRHAEMAYFVLNVLLVLVLTFVALRFCGVAITAARVLGTASLILLTRPGEMALFAGQPTIAIVIGTYLALSLGGSRPAAGGLGFALACLKPTFGVPLGVLMLASRQRRAVVLGAGVVAFSCAIVTIFLVYAAGGVTPLFEPLWDRACAREQRFDVSTATSPFRVDAAAFVGHLLGRTFGVSEELAVTAAILGLSAWLMWKLARQGRQTSEPFVASLACLGLLTGIYHQTYDALVLVLPVAALVSGRAAGSAARWQRWLALGLLLVPAVNYLMTPPVSEALHLQGRAWQIAISLNAGVLLAVFLLYVTIALRAPDPARAAALTDRQLPLA